MLYIYDVLLWVVEFLLVLITKMFMFRGVHKDKYGNVRYRECKVREFSSSGNVVLQGSLLHCPGLHWASSVLQKLLCSGRLPVWNMYQTSAFFHEHSFFKSFIAVLWPLNHNNGRKEQNFFLHTYQCNLYTSYSEFCYNMIIRERFFHNMSAFFMWCDQICFGWGREDIHVWCGERSFNCFHYSFSVTQDFLTTSVVL